ncbi:hypothetical protein GH714_036669 [Hevea brasiliensis]|uniref:UBA domain-containing protein n=1 Tax=Hevea brasiliensis TaxID=3981 RepID=A0A6A6NF14_HEVBR|nr:hypothetical protein GH714_036669 [Hevea brasiliensis]
MSPSSRSKSKSKDKASARASKEQQKASTKPSGSTNTASANPASAYNPISGTFHNLEIPSAASSHPFHDIGRFKNIDDTDEHSSSPRGTVSECDSVSNNGSCSDNDRREKIRLKNEKKHQRQRERRAQELHERCSGYLMSRKLEDLSQQLVAMGFSRERATLALVLNEGKVEESVNWLFEASEDEAHSKDIKLGSACNLKIDIREELAQILAMEVRYKFSKQEVERAVVACEGDLEKAEEILQTQKQESPATTLTPEETTDANHLKRTQEKPMLSASVAIQKRRNERDFNHAKTAIEVPMYSDPGSRNMQSVNQPKSLAEKRWSTSGSSPSSSLARASAMQVTLPSSKLEVRLGVSGNEGKNHQQTLREPVVMMQRPQSINAKQNQLPSVSASPSATTGWYSSIASGVESVRSLLPNQSTGSLGLVNQNTEQFYHPASYKESPFLFDGPIDSTSEGLGGSWGTMCKSPSFAAPYEPQGSFGTMNASSPSLAAPSSLGLFSGWGSAGTLGSSSHVDWNTGGLMPEFDYTSIDWTLDSNLSSSKLGMRDGGATKESSSSASLHEWTSFAGKDIFSLPRQFVTSPSP